MKARKPLVGAEELPLFTLAAAGGRQPKGARTGEATARVRPLGHVACPRCSKARVAVEMTASHAVYREHYLMTHSGAAMVCGASGVPLCRLAPRPAPPGAEGPVSCPHA